MAVIDHIDGANRKIYLRQGVTQFHPIDDIYKEVRTLRATNEELRQYDMFIISKGNEPKGGGKATPRYAVLMYGTKIIPYDEDNLITVTGEVITDDADNDATTVVTSGLIHKVDVYFKPPTAEIIYITSGSGLSQEEHDRLFGVPTAQENADAVFAEIVE